MPNEIDEALARLSERIARVNYGYAGFMAPARGLLCSRIAAELAPVRALVEAAQYLASQDHFCEPGRERLQRALALLLKGE